MIMTTAFLDHIVVGVPHLQDAVRHFADRTGVVPVFGGHHEGNGTANYVVRLEGLRGDGTAAYLELLGPDERPGKGVPADASFFGIDPASEPSDGRIVTWAIRPTDFDATLANLVRLGTYDGTVRPLSRLRPDGSRLSWRLTHRVPLPLGGVHPFLIDWGDAQHPASDKRFPTIGVEAFTLRSGSAASRLALSALDADVPVEDGADDELYLRLAGAGGDISFGSARTAASPR